MDARFATNQVEPAGDSVRIESFNGAPHLVAPVVLVREGVLNGGFLSAEAIQASAPGWNSVPVTAPPSPELSGHPTDEDGVFITANRPDVFEQYVIGNTFNVEFDPEINGLVGEMWLNIERAKEVGEVALEVLQRLTHSEPLEVSTGYWHAWEDQSGSFNGEEFTQVQFDLLPDHLATLPRETGACSWEDGCGAPRINQLLPMEESTNTESVAEEDADSAPEGAETDELPLEGASDGTLAERAAHAVHLLTGHTADCQCGGHADESGTNTDTEINSENMTENENTLDFEMLAEHSDAYDADELRELVGERSIDDLLDAFNEGASTEAGTPGDDDDTAEAEGAAEEQIDEDEAEAETEEVPAAASQEEIEALVAERFQAHLDAQERSELVSRIESNSDYESDDLEGASLAFLRKLAEDVEESAEKAKGGAVNYAGRGAPVSATNAEEDEYDTDSIGVLSTLSAREEAE